MLVLIAAGGTAGHLFPAQELAELLGNDSKVLFAGYKLGESAYFQKERFVHHDIVSAPFGRKFWKPFFRGFLEAFRLIRQEKPDVVVGFGSYHTVPVLFAALVLRKKIVLYESNLTLGKVNWLFEPFAKAVAVQFLTGRKKYVQVPLFPWRKPPNPTRQEAFAYYGLNPEIRTVLVFGGSQGAKFLNERMPQVLRDVQVVHLAGSDAAAAEVRQAYERAGISSVVKGFERQMEMAYTVADVAVCRSGAGTISELIRFQVPSLLIPYPFAYGHQQHNASYLEKLGGAMMILQENASVEALSESLQRQDFSAMRVALRAAEEQNSGLMRMEELVRYVAR